MSWKKEEAPPVEVILGKCPSKSNRYKVGKGKLYKDDTVTRYEKAFALQMKHYKGKGIDYPFEFHMTVFFANNRSDLDGAFKVVLDIMQSTNAIKNDALCVHINARKLIDKKNPRIEFYLKAA